MPDPTIAATVNKMDPEEIRSVLCALEVWENAGQLTAEEVVEWRGGIVERWGIPSRDGRG